MEPGTWNMLRQILSGVGAGLNPDPWVQNLNKMTQQQVGAESQAGLIDLYKNILSGKMPGAKANLSDKGMNLTMPSNALDLGGGELPADQMGQTPSPRRAFPVDSNTPTEQTGDGGFLSKLLNPSASQPGNIPASALVGLSSQDVSAALSGALNIEQLRQEQITNTFSMMQELSKEPEDERTAAIKNYEYSVAQGSEKTFDEFNRDARTAHEKNFERAVSEGYVGRFHEWLRDMTALGGGLSLGEKIEEKKAFSKLKGQLYFDDPDWIGDLSKHMDSKSVRSSVLFSDNPKQAKSEESVKFIENKISAGGGTIQEVKFAEDGKTMIWTIRWPSGDVEIIKHAVRD